MKIIKGFTEIEPTDEIRAMVQDKRLLEGDNLLVQEMRFGESGVIRLIGNRNPDPIKHRELVAEVGAILYEGYCRRIAMEREEKEGQS